MQIRTAVREFCHGYFATSTRSELTRRAYASDLAQFTSFVRPRTRLRSLSAASIERWGTHLQGSSYSPASIRRKLATLRVFFSYWVRKGVLAASPTWQLRMRFGPTLRLPRCLTESEISSLLRTARGSEPLIKHSARVDRSFLSLRNRAIVDLLFATGIRVGEASSLDIVDYCDETNSLRIKGKGGRSRLAFLVDTAAIHSHTTYLEARSQIRSASPALFLNASGTRLSTQGFAYGIRSLAVDAAISRRVTPHMLRHTAATCMLKNGADLRTVQEFLGHASILTTQRYTHVAKEHLISTLHRCHPARALRA